MFQSFVATGTPEQGPPRLAELRKALLRMGLTGFWVPRADAHQGEYVAARDARLEWLSGFSGSAGFCIVLPHVAGVFIDGRYRVQVRAQVADVFTPVPWPEVKPGEWLREKMPDGGVVGYDPWLHTRDELDKVINLLEGSGITLRAVANPVDALWNDQPAPPKGRVMVHPEALAGESAPAKRKRMADVLRAAGQKAVVLTLPDSLCWLLNIRGADVPKNPVVLAFAVLHDSGLLDLVIDPDKLDPIVQAHLGADVRLAKPENFGAVLDGLAGPVRVDRGSAPIWVSDRLDAAGIAVSWGEDPCILPKARKNAAEIEGMRQAHLRDGAAMVEFLAWLEAAAHNGLTEIGVTSALEGFRRAGNTLHDISFDTICGAGPNGAIMHYRVTDGTNRPWLLGELMVVDSGGQYLDGTTDITRTVVNGMPTEEQQACFTRVLQGMIAISRVRWPKGLAGRDLDGLARFNLWLAGQDYDHGTGHGVGAFLSVHEGPQRISRISEVVLEPGMVLSNEPGYYREGAFGIRIENLIVAQEALSLPGGDARAMLSFETLTWVPIERRLILPDRLSPDERDWINSYHAEVRKKIAPRVSATAQDWLAKATEPLGGERILG